MQQQSTAASVANLTKTLQRAMVRKVELLDELEQVNKTISGIREGLQGVQLGQKLEQEIMLERAQKLAADREADRAAHHDISN